MNRIQIMLIAAAFSIGVIACTVNHHTEKVESPDGKVVEKPSEEPKKTDQAEARFPEGTVGAELLGYTKIKITRSEWGSKPGDRKDFVGEVTDQEIMDRIFELINPHQTHSEMSATCIFSYTLDFLDKDDNTIGRVGLCLTSKTQASFPGAVMNVDGTGKPTSRRGIVIRTASELSEIMHGHLQE